MRPNPDPLLELLREEHARCTALPRLIEQQEALAHASQSDKASIVAQQLVGELDRICQIRRRRQRLQKQFARECGMLADVSLPELLQMLPDSSRARAELFLKEGEAALRQLQDWLRREEQALIHALAVSEKMIRSLKPESRR